MKRIIPIIPIPIAIFLIGIYINPLPSQVDPSPPPSEKTSGTSQKIQGVVKPGETMFDIFKKNGLDLRDLFRLREASASVHRLRDISTGQPYKIELGGDGESALLGCALSDIFSWDIDFTTDLRKGDTFQVVVEELWLGGRFKRYGNILAAEFTNDGNTYRAFRYEGPDGRAGYYDEEGKSLQRSFLKAPLSYRRISSGFTFSRMHPILKIRRPHLGVDYVAPGGTPVSALGDGSVQFAGDKGANGNLVIIRHPKGFITYYGHLRRIRTGIRPGARVAQGDVIGYVGSTGLSTGPHLDFRMKKGDRFVNPLGVNIPRGDGIPKQFIADYNRSGHALGLVLASIVPVPREPGPESGERTIASSR